MMTFPEVGFTFQCEGQLWMVSEPTWEGVVIAQNGNGTVQGFVQVDGKWVRSQIPKRKLGQ
jgi:hypothetical protein